MTRLDDATAELDKGFARLAVPAHLADGLRRYCLNGDPVGHFLTAVVENDLREAISRGDDEALAGLKPIFQLLYNYAPGGCYGSPAIRKSWQERGGVRGRKES